MDLKCQKYSINLLGASASITNVKSDVVQIEIFKLERRRAFFIKEDELYKIEEQLKEQKKEELKEMAI